MHKKNIIGIALALFSLLISGCSQNMDSSANALTTSGKKPVVNSAPNSKAKPAAKTLPKLPSQVSTGSKLAPGTVQTPVTQNTITIQNFAFVPGGLTIAQGQMVVWKNNDRVPHTITSNTGIFSSPILAPGATFRFTFPNPGRYDYHCNLHPSMKGMVLVK